MKIKKKKKFCFDLDGVICRTIRSSYHKSKPILSSIKKINELYDKGNYIIIFTARYMGRNNDNIYKAKKMGYNLTLRQLKLWGVKYNKLIFGKPSYDIIIDDKAIFYSSKWKNKI